MSISLERPGLEETKLAGEHHNLNIPLQMRTNFRYAGMHMDKSLRMG